MSPLYVLEFCTATAVWLITVIELFRRKQAIGAWIVMLLPFTVGPAVPAFGTWFDTPDPGALAGMFLGFGLGLWLGNPGGGPTRWRELLWLLTLGRFGRR